MAFAMHRLMILLSMVYLAWSASLDSDACARGESVWCQSLEAAEECSAVDHCMETIWKNQKLEKDESTTCLFCEAVVSDARQRSAAGKSQVQIIAFLNSAVDLLPDCDMTTQIRKTIRRESIPDILNSEIAPQMVCNLLNVCNGPQNEEEDLHKPNSSPEEAPKPREENKVLQPSSCPDCKSFIISLKTLLTTQTPALLTDVFLDKVCPRTATFKTQCEYLAKTYLPETLKMITSFLDENAVCQGIRMCTKSKLENEWSPDEEDFSVVDWNEVLSFLAKNPQPERSVELRLPSSCPDCTNFFDALKNLLNTQTPLFITDVLIDNVCSRMGKRKQSCETYVNGYLPSVIKFAANFLDSKKVCLAAKMCPKSKSDINDMNSFSWTKLILPNDTNVLDQQSSCADCTKFFTSVRDLLKGDASVFLTDVLVDQICPMTGSFRKQCEDFAKTYLKIVVDLVTNTMDPAKVCKSIGMCKRYENEIESDLYFIDLSLIDWESLTGNQGDSKCEACKAGVLFVQNFLKNPATRGALVMVIKNFVCAPLGPLRIPCQAIASTLIQNVLDLTAKFLDPSKVCRMIRMCKSSDVSLMEDSVPVALGEPETMNEVVKCAVCETVVDVIRAAIDSNKTEADMLKGMHALCGQMPSKRVAGICNRFVNLHGQQIIELIRSQLQPHDVCVKFHLCTAFNSDLFDVGAEMWSEPCIICRSAVQYVEALVDETDTVAMIQAQLRTICHSLPPQLEQDVCLPFVAKYIPSLIHELSVFLPPKFFCTKIRICDD